MKSVVLLFLLFVVMIGCESNSVQPANPSNTFKALINGESWTGRAVGLRVMRLGAERISVTGTKINDNTSVMLVLDGITQPGDYKIEGENQYMQPRFASYMSNSGTFYAEKGMIKISGISKESAQGEFSFIAINPDGPNAPDTAIITQGEFDVAF